MNMLMYGWLAARFCGNARNAKDEFRSVKAGVGIGQTGAITPGWSLTIRAYWSLMIKAYWSLIIATDVNRVQLISSAIMFDHIEAGIMSDLNRSQVMVKMILSLQELITELDHKITEGCYSTHDSYLERFPHSGSIGRSQTLQSRRRGCKEMED